MRYVIGASDVNFILRDTDGNRVGSVMLDDVVFISDDKQPNDNVDVYALGRICKYVEELFGYTPCFKDVFINNTYQTAIR